jgi:hypothetical protein
VTVTVTVICNFVHLFLCLHRWLVTEAAFMDSRGNYLIITLEKPLTYERPRSIPAVTVPLRKAPYYPGRYHYERPRSIPAVTITKGPVLSRPLPLRKAPQHPGRYHHCDLKGPAASRPLPLRKAGRDRERWEEW